jgi:hypothetical protein
MTYPADCTLPTELLEQIASEGLDCLPALLRTIINTAMQVERQQHLGVEPYERSVERTRHANGYKPKTVTTRVGEVTFEVPQVREGNFYPQALEKGTQILSLMSRAKRHENQDSNPFGAKRGPRPRSTVCERRPRPPIFGLCRVQLNARKRHATGSGHGWH